jgi:hypothetical protein
MRKIFLAILLVPALAWGAPTSASDWYKEGANQYTLGNFEKAIDAFKRGFELETDDSKRAAYLYNIAQAYRQSNDCVKAQFFYKRFLSLKAADTVKPLSDKDRKSVEDFIKDLEPCAQQAASLGKRPPDSLQSDGDSGRQPDSARKDAAREPVKATRPTSAVTPASKEVAAIPHRAPGEAEAEDEDTGTPTKRAPLAPHLISARLTGGGTKVNAGKIDVPVQAMFALIAGYPIPVNRQLTVDAGLAFTFAPVPYTVAAQGTLPERNKTGQLMSIMANASPSYELIPQLDVRADIGVGALLFNASESEFTMGNPTSGILSMFHIRTALSVDYAVTPNVLITAAPFGFSYSPAKAGLDRSITSITAFDFMVGVGYRM